MHMRSDFATLSSERGSVLLWTVSCLAIGLLAVVTTISVVDLSRTQARLQSLADGAALVGANQLSLTSFLKSGNVADVSINPANATAAVISWLKRDTLSVRLSSLRVSGTLLSIQVSAAWRSPIAWGAFPAHTIAVSSEVRVAQAP